MALSIVILASGSVGYKLPKSATLRSVIGLMTAGGLEMLLSTDVDQTALLLDVPPPVTSDVVVAVDLGIPLQAGTKLFQSSAGKMTLIFD